MLIVDYCYGIRSEWRLCEEVHLNLAYRWFCRLGLDGRVPDHSSFSGGAQGVACGFVNSASSGSQSKAPGFAWGYLLLYQRNSRPADIVGAFVEHAESCLNESLAHVLQIFGGLHAVSVEFHGAVIVTAAYQRAHAFKVLHSGKVHNVICCIQKAGCERQDG
jgi:hypothetical protein